MAWPETVVFLCSSGGWVFQFFSSLLWPYSLLWGFPFQHIQSVLSTNEFRGFSQESIIRNMNPGSIYLPAWELWAVKSNSTRGGEMQEMTGKWLSWQRKFTRAGQLIMFCDEDAHNSHTSVYWTVRAQNRGHAGCTRLISWCEPKQDVLIHCRGPEVDGAAVAKTQQHGSAQRWARALLSSSQHFLNQGSSPWQHYQPCGFIIIAVWLWTSRVFL